jgi:hypothetical protein
MASGYWENADPVNMFILLLHPIVALAVIVWMVRQHRWRQRGSLLKGEDRKSAVQSHERDGEKIYIVAWFLVIGGFTANVITNFRSTGHLSFDSLLPSGAGGLHAGGGLLGMALLTVLWRKGRATKKLRDSGEKWASEKQRHGRASDVIMILIAIHAFLGFLWLIQLYTPSSF